MATFRFELSNKPNRNKKYILMLCVTVAGKRKRIKTQIELDKPGDFNPKCRNENWVRASVPNAKVMNAQLSAFLAKAKETYNEIDKSGEVSSAKVATVMNTEYVSPSFMEFARERTQMLYDSGSFRNWKKYNGFINKLEAFRKKRRYADITIDDLTVDFMTRFDHFLHKWENEREPGKLLHPNTIEVQFNIMRSLVNKAIEVGIMEASKNPFLVFKYKGVKTVKEKLEDDEMQLIIDLELEEGSLMWHSKNYFLFSYYCAGIRAADLIQLRWSNISASGRLRYQMGKNHKERDLVLVDQAIEILQYYNNDDVRSSDYIFPLLSNDAEYASLLTLADQDRMRPELRQKMYEDISSKNALINKYLKKVAEKAGITKTVSMHISRHSFAHIAQESGAESGAIKEILGHANLATTERYMGSFNTSKTDNTLRTLFKKRAKAKTLDSSMSRVEQAIALLRDMTPEEIGMVITAINK